MKKFIFTACFTILFAGVALFALSACGSRDDALVGTWEWDEASIFIYTFNADGSGSRGVPGVEYETFSWSTSGDRLNINRDTRDEFIRNERWTYTISGNRLTIDNRQTDDIFSYIRRP